MKDNEIRLSPMVRMTMTFDQELNLDKNGVFGNETYLKYIERHSESIAKQEQLMRSLFTLNALIFLMLSGQNWTIPFFNVQLSALPAILEILLFTSSITFYFTCAAFVTSQCYSGIVDQFGNRIVNSALIDPDFFNASRKHFEFFTKLYRPKMNIWGVDFYEHKWGFAGFSLLMNVIMFAVLLILPLTHLAVVGTAAWQVLHSDWNAYAKWFLLVATAIINFGGLAMVYGMGKEFTFKIIEAKPADEQVVDEN